MIRAETQVDLVRLDSGSSAYQIWLDAGNTGTEEQFLASLKGANGKGIVSASLKYQIHSNGVSIPTGTWEDAPYATTSAKPYLWSRLIFTYTDGTQSEPSYCVGATPEGVQANIDAVANNFSNFLNTTYAGDIQNIQNQIDGAIQFWNGANIPTLNNYPTSGWTTETAKENHRADIYTVITDVNGQLKQGKSYRFDRVNGVWQWIELTDNELSAVQALASSKAKVFVNTPIPPYDIGDLWINNQEIYKCTTAKSAGGTYSASDWGEATKYTDDTVANQANSKIDSLAIGSRNLLLNSDFKKTTTASGETSMHHNLYPVGYNGYNGGITNPTINYHAHIDNDTFGFNVCEFNESNGNRNWKGISSYIKIEETGEYTFSCDIYATGSGTQIFTGISGRHKETNNTQFHSNIRYIYPDEINKWKRYSVTVSLNNTIDFSKDIMLYVYGYSFTTNSVVYIKNVKLEKGNKATDWTPAPEDINNKVDELQEQNTEQIAQDLIDLAETLTASAEEIMSSSLQGYATTEALNNEKTLIVDALNLQEEDLNDKISTLRGQLETLGGEVSNQSNYLRIEDTNIVLGKTGSLFTSVFTSNSLEFRYNNTPIAWFNTNELVTKQIKIENQLSYYGDWAVRKGAYVDGVGYNLNDVWIGG